MPLDASTARAYTDLLHRELVCALGCTEPIALAYGASLAAAALGEPLVFAVGNAPTALVRLYEMLQAGEMSCPPALIIGVPVGFVNVVESKELICELDVPHIVARGRKGGSNVAAAIVNALLYLASHGERE